MQGGGGGGLRGATRLVRSAATPARADGPLPAHGPGGDRRGAHGSWLSGTCSLDRGGGRALAALRRRRWWGGACTSKASQRNGTGRGRGGQAPRGAGILPLPAAAAGGAVGACTGHVRRRGARSTWIDHRWMGFSVARINLLASYCTTSVPGLDLQDETLAAAAAGSRSGS
jgi:hypothetical protein